MKPGIRSITLASILITNLCLPASAQEFESVELVSGETPFLVDYRAGDIDGDGHVDILSSGRVVEVGSPGFGVVAWHRNTGDGLLAPPVTIFSQSGFELWQVFLADVDGDGDLDAIETTTSFPGSVNWQENLGFGVFGPTMSLGSNPGAIDVAVADFDLDGTPDVAVGGSAEIVWYRGLGGGAFDPAVVVWSGFLRWIRAGDVDGDGDVDLIANGTDAPFLWLANDGLGGFGIGGTLEPVANVPDFEFVDVDGDGDGDIIAVDADPSAGAVRWYENDGLGGFTDHLVDGLTTPAEIEGDDMDGDGDIDLLVHANPFPDPIFWYSNVDGQGGFVDQIYGTQSWSAGGGVPLVIADVDGDTLPDVVRGMVGTLTWHRNEGGRFADGYGQLMTYYDSPAYGASGDLDGDGDLDLVSDVGGTSLTPVWPAWFEQVGGDVGYAPARLLPALSTTDRLRLGDLDGDGDLDVLAAGNLSFSPGQSAIAWLENDGSATFAEEEYLVLDLGSAGHGDLGLADVDLDGHLDVVAKGDGTGSIGLAWYRNDGSGAGVLDLEVAIDTSHGSVDELELGDIDADGDLDVATEYLGSVRTHENLDGLGGAWSSVDVVVDPDIHPLGSSSFDEGFQLADLDGDDRLDILLRAGIVFPPSQAKELRWYRNTAGAASYGPGEMLEAYLDGTWSFLVADVDEDGTADLLESGRLAGQSDPRLRVRLGDGSAPASWPATDVGPGVHIWDLPDVDGDGDGDLLGTRGGPTTSALEWFRNTFTGPLHAVEDVRFGSPPNPVALLPGQTSGPVLGQTWDPVIDHTWFLPTAIADYLLISLTPANLSAGPKGTLLCGAPFLDFLPVNFAPGTPFLFPLPNDPILVGVPACVQGASQGGGVFRLTNALDITFGDA